MYKLFNEIKNDRFRAIYVYFEGILPYTYKFGEVHTLAYRYSQICSRWNNLHT